MGNACFGPSSHQTDLENNTPKEKTLSGDTKQPRISAKTMKKEDGDKEDGDKEVVKPEHRRNSILAVQAIKYEHSDDEKSEEDALDVEIEYFEAHGRAEPIRMMLFSTGVEFRNKYVTQEEWPKLKPNKVQYPTGGLPIVSINGKRYYETMSTLRSLAMGIGVYETSDHKGCYVNDIIMDEYNNVFEKSGALIMAQNEEEKKIAFGNFLAAIDRILCIVKMNKVANKWKYAAGNEDLGTGDFCIAALYFNFAKNEAFEASMMVLPVFEKHVELADYYAILQKALRKYLKQRKTLPF